MPKKPQVRKLLDGSIFVTFFYHSEKNHLQKFCFSSTETLRRFVNILTPDENYCLSVKATV